MIFKFGNKKLLISQNGDQQFCYPIKLCQTIQNCLQEKDDYCTLYVKLDSCRLSILVP